jgi:hypothetical protein
VKDSMTSRIDSELFALNRGEVRHSLMSRLEHLVWERVTLQEERLQQRRVRSSVLIFSIAVAFVGGIIVGGHETDRRSRALLIDDAELLLPVAIN